MAHGITSIFLSSAASSLPAATSAWALALLRVVTDDDDDMPGFRNLSHGDTLSGSASRSLLSLRALLFRATHQKHTRHQYECPASISTCSTLGSDRAASSSARAAKKPKLQQPVCATRMAKDRLLVRGAVQKVRAAVSQRGGAGCNLAMTLGLASMRMNLETNDLSDAASVLAWRVHPDARTRDA